MEREIFYVHGLLIFFMCRYVDYCQLEQPCDDIVSVLTATAKRIGALMKGNYISKRTMSTCLPLKLLFNTLLHRWSV